MRTSWHRTTFATSRVLGNACAGKDHAPRSQEHPRGDPHPARDEAAGADPGARATTASGSTTAAGMDAARERRRRCSSAAIRAYVA